MNTDIRKYKKYIAPAIIRVRLDHEISLALESENDYEPPILESRNFNTITHSNPYQTI